MVYVLSMVLRSSLCGYTNFKKSPLKIEHWFWSGNFEIQTKTSLYLVLNENIVLDSAIHSSLFNKNHKGILLWTNALIKNPFPIHYYKHLSIFRTEV